LWYWGSRGGLAPKFAWAYNKPMKKIPYGLANFEAVKEQDKYYYVDKTRFIAELETLGSKFHFFLRPRRFGKSLFLSTLEHYYDPNRAGQFNELFGDTWIGQNPTPLKNKLPVLKLNFSGIPTDGDIDASQTSFLRKLKGDIHSFYVYYPELTGGVEQFEHHLGHLDGTVDIFNEFIRLMYDAHVQFIMLIDEYDNFANNVLIHHGADKYRAITHAGGFLRSFFAAIKNATESRTVERLFVTGVSPLVLSDVTSGMNIGDNISPKAQFNAMAGFTQAEVEAMLDYYIDQGLVPVAERPEIVDLLRVNYNNYCFSENTEDRIYNSDMVLYFFNNYHQAKKIPSNLLDENVRIDYAKLQFLVTEGPKLNGNFNILSEIMDQQQTECELHHSFALSEILDNNKFKSFLYYLGLLTMKEHYYGSSCSLMVPNEVVRTMHYSYLRGAISDGYGLKLDINLLTKEFNNLAFKGQWQTIIGHILERLYEAVSLRDFVFREQVVKAFLLAWLGMTPLYFVQSEPEMNHGYADIFLQKNYFTTHRTSHEYLIEVKFMSAEEQASPNARERYRAAAIAQLERYAASQKITCQVHKLIVLAGAKELLLLEEI
jgi:hypothetical protein